MSTTIESNGDVRIQATNFDVVANELPGPMYALLEDKQQIGNNRFNVLIDMYAGAFNSNYSENNQNECDKIIGTIQDVTCRKKGQSQSCSPGGNGGRFLVRTTGSTNDNNGTVDREWTELDEEASKKLIRQTLKSRTEDKTEDLYEPVSLLDSIGFGRISIDMNYNNNNTAGSQQLVIRRSRSASNMMLDAQKAFGELPTFGEIEAEDDFEPMPIDYDDPDIVIDIDILGSLEQDLNRSKKKRGRRRSLLRRSNSFESAFEKKKTFKNLYGALPPSSKLQPSFIRSHHTSNNEVDHSGSSSRNFMSRALNYAISNIPGVESDASRNPEKGGITVPTYKGMDVVFTGDCKKLSTKPTIIGNNRLRILLILERERFLRLSPMEQNNTASDLINTVTKDWKGRVLVDKGFSYNTLSQTEATIAMHNLLLGGNSSSTSSQDNVVGPLLPTLNYTSSISTSNTLSTTTSSSLLSAAPALPAFLQNASTEILSSSRKKSPNEETPEERQAAAINELKARNKNRQLAKEKGKDTKRT